MDVMKGCSREDVARRAYELFLSRGGQHGSDIEDWLQAERQLHTNGGTNGSHVSSNGSHPAASRSAPAKARAPKTRKSR
jgi:hypothetical protein